MGNKKWGDRDWTWLEGILIVIIIFLIANVFDYVHIEANFSIISSAVSIALALVAIFIALKQDSDNQRVNNQVSYVLHEISANVKKVDAKLDPNVLKSVSKISEETVDEYSQEIGKKDSYTKEEVDEILNKFSKDITVNINGILNENAIKAEANSEYSCRHAHERMF